MLPYCSSRIIPNTSLFVRVKATKPLKLWVVRRNSLLSVYINSIDFSSCSYTPPWDLGQLGFPITLCLFQRWTTLPNAELALKHNRLLTVWMLDVIGSYLKARQIYVRPLQRLQNISIFSWLPDTVTQQVLSNAIKYLTFSYITHCHL